MAKLPGRGSGGERRGKGGRRAWEAQWETEGYRRFLSRRLNRSSCSKRRRRCCRRRFGASWRRKPWSETRSWSLCVWAFAFCPWLSECVSEWESERCGVCEEKGLWSRGKKRERWGETGFAKRAQHFGLGAGLVCCIVYRLIKAFFFFFLWFLRKKVKENDIQFSYYGEHLYIRNSLCTLLGILLGSSMFTSASCVIRKLWLAVVLCTPIES